MKELEFLEIIKETLSKKDHIGDDCAYLQNLGIVMTQDSLVEDIHFSIKFTSPYSLACKALLVNLSDIFASGAIPKYVTVSLSLPDSVDKTFVREFYRACEDLSKRYDFEIVGGDITGGDKIFASVCVIGLTNGRNISSRKNAKVGDYVICSGEHGSSAAGLYILNNFSKEQIESSDVMQKLVKTHQEPIIQEDFSKEIAVKVGKYAMMDTSDGLVDAVFKIAQASGVMISVDFDKIVYDKKIEKFAQDANVDYKDWVLYGGEDYQLIACLSKEELDKIDVPYHIIGEVKEKVENHSVEINNQGEVIKIKDLEKTFNHFGGKNEN